MGLRSMYFDWKYSLALGHGNTLKINLYYCLKAELDKLSREKH